MQILMYTYGDYPSMSKNIRMVRDKNTYTLEIQRKRQQRNHRHRKSDVCARIKQRMRANIDVYVC